MLGVGKVSSSPIGPLTGSLIGVECRRGLTFIFSCSGETLTLAAVQFRIYVGGLLYITCSYRPAYYT